MQKKVIVLLTCILQCCRQTLSNKNTKATLIFGGDVSFSGAFKYFASQNHECDYEKPFAKIQHIFRDADFTMVNLESPILAKDPKNFAFVPGISFASEEKSLKALRDVGVDAVSVANNHFLDFGPNGANATVHALKKHKMGFVGVSHGTESLDNQTPLIRTINGVKVGFLAYCYVVKGCKSMIGLSNVGPAVFSLSSAHRDIQKLTVKEAVDHVIVFMHWGMEFVTVPPLFIRKLAHKLMTLGAKIIIGCHPHVSQVHEQLQSYELPLLAVYSLGNLLFPPHTSNVAPFRPWGEGTEKDAANFITSMQNPWDLTRYGKLLKLELTKDKMERALFLPYEIKLNKENNCTQPTPTLDVWTEVCGPTDLLQCLDLDSFFSEEPKDLD